MSERYLRLSEVTNITGLSRSSIYNMMTENRFPLALRLGVRSVRWREADVVTWLRARPAIELRSFQLEG